MFQSTWEAIKASGKALSRESKNVPSQKSSPEKQYYPPPPGWKNLQPVIEEPQKSFHTLKNTFEKCSASTDTPKNQNLTSSITKNSDNCQLKTRQKLLNILPQETIRNPTDLEFIDRQSCGDVKSFSCLKNDTKSSKTNTNFKETPKKSPIRKESTTESTIKVEFIQKAQAIGQRMLKGTLIRPPIPDVPKTENSSSTVVDGEKEDTKTINSITESKCSNESIKNQQNNVNDEQENQTQLSISFEKREKPKLPPLPAPEKIFASTNGVVAQVQNISTETIFRNEFCTASNSSCSCSRDKPALQ